jgi:hypothetical protein
MVVMFYNFTFYAFFLFMMNIYIFPQIIHTAIRGQPIQFDKLYIIGLLSSRSLIPVLDYIIELYHLLISCTSEAAPTTSYNSVPTPSSA